jgi:putative two-component system response regulator
MDGTSQATLLIVDHSADNLVRLEAQLQERYHVKLARTGQEGLRIAAQHPRPDLMLVAAQLPDLDLVELLRQLRAHFMTAQLPVLALVSSEAGLAQPLRAGADDVLALDTPPEVLERRVALHLQLRSLQGALRDQDRRFEHLVAERTRSVVQMQDATIVAMACLAESRDPDIGQHIRRTQHYVAALARELRFHSAFTAELTNENVALIVKAVPLHDIGKAGMPDEVLFKPSKLSSHEFETMKAHTVLGCRAIAGVAEMLGESTPFLRYAQQIALSHHEKWDGSGYPEGLAGEAIPLAARMMAVADVYDALISPRSYRPAFTHETAIEMIRLERGEHFDPEVVDAALAVEDKLRAIALEFGVPAAE